MAAVRRADDRLLEGGNDARRELWCFSMIYDRPPPPSRDACLFLDVDGTLIELSDTPFDAHADDELKRLLQNVSNRMGGALALVSGRSIEYLDALFAPLRLPCAGLHGVERRTAQGLLHGAELPASCLDPVRPLLVNLVKEHIGTLLEDKGPTIAVHYRLAPQFADEVRAKVESIAASLSDRYQVQSGNMMLEIKPRGPDKGTAIKAFLGEPPFKDRKPVYVGDDLTDLHGFKEVVAQGGFSIGVGRRVTGQFQLDDPAAVRAWLREL
jgi:trehalose 6-phosphate phosphatase